MVTLNNYSNRGVANCCKFIAIKEDARLAEGHAMLEQYHSTDRRKKDKESFFTG
jgi:hypothetical protein